MPECAPRHEVPLSGLVERLSIPARVRSGRLRLPGSAPAALTLRTPVARRSSARNRAGWPADFAGFPAAPRRDGRAVMQRIANPSTCNSVARVRFPLPPPFAHAAALQRLSPITAAGATLWHGPSRVRGIEKLQRLPPNWSRRFSEIPIFYRAAMRISAKTCQALNIIAKFEFPEYSCTKSTVARKMRGHGGLQGWKSIQHRKRRDCQGSADSGFSS